jgi:L-alanine-DL-glutamate epimerase-like enolase superfamily enzyme
VQLEWEDGYLLPPTQPGLGIEFDETAALANPYREVDAPQLCRPDGAFTNW